MKITDLNYEVCTRKDRKDLAVPEIHVASASSQTDLPSWGIDDDYTITCFSTYAKAKAYLRMHGFEKFRRVDYHTFSTEV